MVQSVKLFDLKFKFNLISTVIFYLARWEATSMWCWCFTCICGKYHWKFGSYCWMLWVTWTMSWHLPMQLKASSSLQTTGLGVELQMMPTTEGDRNLVVSHASCRMDVTRLESWDVKFHTWWSQRYFHIVGSGLRTLWGITLNV